MADGVTDEQTASASVKRAVLTKFEGDPTQEQIDSGEAKPFETHVIEYDENENIISHEVIQHDAEGGD